MKFSISNLQFSNSKPGTWSLIENWELIIINWSMIDL